jgi:hypothetical protein
VTLSGGDAAAISDPMELQFLSNRPSPILFFDLN